VVGCWDAVPSAANVGYHIGVVAEHSLRRRMLEAAHRITELASDLDTEVDTALDQAEQTMLAVGKAIPATASTPSAGCYRPCWNTSNSSKPENLDISRHSHRPSRSRPPEPDPGTLQEGGGRLDPMAFEYAHRG